MGDKQLFLDYFFSGSDQEQEDTLLTLGVMIAKQLYEKGTAKIDVQTLEEGVDMDDFEDWCTNQAIQSVLDAHQEQQKED
jgi:hypothetical protein